MKYRYLTIDQGLVHNNIRHISQDCSGYIWIVTENGLNKYDGYEVINYMHDPADTLTISSNVVYSVFVDSKNNVWVSSRGGINLYNREKDNFARYQPYDINKTVTMAYAMDEDKFGQVWIGTDLGLISHNLETGTNQLYTPDNNIGPKPNTNTVAKVYISDDNKVTLVLKLKKYIPCQV